MKWKDEEISIENKSGQIRVTDCMVYKKICFYFRQIKDLYIFTQQLTREKDIDKTSTLKHYSDTIILYRQTIETLCLVLFHTYQVASIDPYSLDNYLDGKENRVRVCFVGKNINSFVYFEP